MAYVGEDVLLCLCRSERYHDRGTPSSTLRVCRRPGRPQRGLTRMGLGGLAGTFRDVPALACACRAHALGLGYQARLPRKNGSARAPPEASRPQNPAAPLARRRTPPTCSARCGPSGRTWAACRGTRRRAGRPPTRRLTYATGTPQGRGAR